MGVTFPGLKCTGSDFLTGSLKEANTVTNAILSQGLEVRRPPFPRGPLSSPQSAVSADPKTVRQVLQGRRRCSTIAANPFVLRFLPPCIFHAPLLLMFHHRFQFWFPYSGAKNLNFLKKSEWAMLNTSIFLQMSPQPHWSWTNLFFFF